MRRISLIPGLALLLSCTAWSAEALRTTEPVLKDGVWRFEIESAYQQGARGVSVLLPDDFDKTKKYKVLYVLPVEAAGKHRFGEGLLEVKKAGAQNKHQLICVQPEFALESWFADHPSDPLQRHEGFLLNALLPTIEKKYPAIAAPEGRLLLGFSKSGWGAMTLILRNSEVFGYACTWDAPLMLESLQDAMKERIVTLEQLAKFQPRALMKAHADEFKDKPRLVLLGERNFGTNWSRGRSHTAAAHALMDELGIKHMYDNSLTMPHRWDGGWVAPAIEYLIKISK